MLKIVRLLTINSPRAATTSEQPQLKHCHSDWDNVVDLSGFWDLVHAFVFHSYKCFICVKILINCIETNINKLISGSLHCYQAMYWDGIFSQRSWRVKGFGIRPSWIRVSSSPSVDWEIGVPLRRVVSLWKWNSVLQVGPSVSLHWPQVGIWK